MENSQLTAIQRAELKEAIKLQEEIQKRTSERNDVFDLARRFKGRYVVLIGGSGSGKSYELADIVADRMVREGHSRDIAPHRILGVRNERKQVTESMFPLLRSRVSRRYPDKKFKINEGAGSELLKLGRNEVRFAGLDDVEKLKSIFDITSIWVEEADQIKPEDFRELDRRLRGYHGDMHFYMSFNPVSILSWLKKKFFDDKNKRTICICGRQQFEDFKYYKEFYITDEELNRKVKVFDEHSGTEIEEYYYNTLIIHTTYLDNKFLTDQDYTMMNTLHNDDPGEYNVFGLGNWGIQGGTYFDKINIMKRIQDNEPIIARGSFEFQYINYEINLNTITWVEDPFGYIKIYKFPEKHTPYVIGGDTSGEGSDWNTATVHDNTTKEDVASLRVNFDEDLYARQLYCLGYFYGELNSCSNCALIGIEVNFSTHPNKELMRWNYPNLYIRNQSPDSMTGKLQDKYGFATTKATRPLALGMLRTVMREEPYLIKDMDTLQEMLTFVKNDKGRPEAITGAHDDMVIARAITLAISEQQIDYKEESIGELDLSHLRSDIREDFLNEDKAIQRVLLEKWRKEGLIGVNRHG